MGKKKKVHRGIQMHRGALPQLCTCTYRQRVHVEPKDLSFVCGWLWQPAVRGAQGGGLGRPGERRASGRQGLEPALAHSK